MDVVRCLPSAVLDAGDDPAGVIALTDAYCDAGDERWELWPGGSIGIRHDAGPYPFRKKS